MALYGFGVFPAPCCAPRQLPGGLAKELGADRRNNQPVSGFCGAAAARHQYPAGLLAKTRAVFRLLARASHGALLPGPTVVLLSLYSNRLRKRKNKALFAKNGELYLLSKKLEVLNEDLERRVALRIQRLEQQRERLDNYAWINAHEVRGPLSSILALIMILRSYPQESKENRNKMLASIKLKAKELDAILHRINEELNDLEKREKAAAFEYSPL